jgi:hypothetical protein
MAAGKNMGTNKAPQGVEKFDTAISTYWWGENGILMSDSKPPQRTVENTRENFETVRRISGGKKVCLIVYLCKSPMPDKATRDFVAKNLPTVYNAMAMISDSALATFIMGFLFKLKPPTIPMKSFTNVEAAKAWIAQYNK